MPAVAADGVTVETEFPMRAVVNECGCGYYQGGWVVVVVTIVVLKKGRRKGNKGAACRERGRQRDKSVCVRALLPTAWPFKLLCILPVTASQPEAGPDIPES